MKPYTYLIKHRPTGKVYYGFRSANKVDPEQDLWQHYFTSSILRKDARRAVALVHVEVDDRHLQRAARSVPTRVLGLHQSRRHRGVVEDTEAAALVGIGVVGAASDVGGHALACQCGATGPVL